MTTEEQLLAAIALDPDDDTVRLAYADFLDDLGDEVNQARAEYIRIQIRRQRWPHDPWDSARESQLFLAYGRRWCREPPAGFQMSLGYRRGFPYRAYAKASAVAVAATNVFARLLDELHLTVDVHPEQLWEVIRGPVVRGLKALRVMCDGETPSGIDAVGAVAGGEFPRLERLELGHSLVNDAMLGVLCALEQQFPRLAELDLTYNLITPVGAEALLTSPLGRRLRWVCLASNSINPDAWIDLTTRFRRQLLGGLP